MCQFNNDNLHMHILLGLLLERQMIVCIHRNSLKKVRGKRSVLMPS